MQRSKKHRKGHNKQASKPAQQRVMGGIDSKTFTLNDYVPVTIPTPGNSTRYTVTIQCDVNGYTWAVVGQSGTVSTGTALYGANAGQFQTQALFYTQYYTKSVHVGLNLSQGGACWSLTPVVMVTNPNGFVPFVAASDFQEFFSSCADAKLLNPYGKVSNTISYGNWMVSMQQRAWRKSIETGGTTREIYAADGSTDENFTLPSTTYVFALTIPEATFDSSSAPAVPCIFKISTQYCFSQRRVDINDLVGSMVQLQVKAKAKDMAKRLVQKEKEQIKSKDDLFDDFSD